MTLIRVRKSLVESSPERNLGKLSLLIKCLSFIYDKIKKVELIPNETLNTRHTIFLLKININK